MSEYKRPVGLPLGHFGIEYDFDWYKRASVFYVARKRAKRLLNDFYVNTKFKLEAIANPEEFEKCQLSPDDAKLLLTVLGEKEEWIKARYR